MTQSIVKQEGHDIAEGEGEGSRKRSVDHYCQNVMGISVYPAPKCRGGGVLKRGGRGRLVHAS